MATIGNQSTGFITNVSTDLVAIASKFTAPSTFTPNKIVVSFSEGFGASGTVYVSVYSDSSGAVGNMLFSASSAYAASFSGWKTVAASGTELANATDYWLAAYWVKDSGTLLIQPGTGGTGSILNWTETTAGSWTNSPTTGSQDILHYLAIYADDSVATTSSSSLTTTSSSSSITTTSSSSSRTTTSSSSSKTTTSSSSSSSSSITTTSSSSSITTTSSSSSSVTTTSSSSSITTTTSSTLFTVSTTSGSVTTTSSSSSITTTSSSSHSTTSSSSSHTTTTTSSVSTITTTSSSSSSTSTTSSSISTSTSTSTIMWEPDIDMSPKDEMSGEVDLW